MVPLLCLLFLNGGAGHQYQHFFDFDPLLSLHQASHINIENIDPADVYQAVMANQKGVLESLIQRAHRAGDDHIFGELRRGLTDLRASAENLSNRLNPSFETPVVLAPAYQWAQNETTIMLNVKYSSRWNAPGAVDLIDQHVGFREGGLDFWGVSEHSKKRQNYTLSLDFFDFIRHEEADWRAASVGTMTISMPKVRMFRWPRLLATSAKQSNMHLWAAHQDSWGKGSLALPVLETSPTDCQSQGHLMCFSEDQCVATCESCPDKPHASQPPGICQGTPSEGALDFELSFVDDDLNPNAIGGNLRLTRDPKNPIHNWDVQEFQVFWGKANQQLKKSWWSKVPVLARLDFPVSGHFEPLVIPIPMGSEPPSEADSLVVHAVNEHGPSATGQGIPFKDLARPRGKIYSMVYSGLPDEDDQFGHVKTTLKVQVDSPGSLVSNATELLLYLANKKGKRLRLLARLSLPSADPLFELEETKIPFQSVVHVVAANADLEAEEFYGFDLVDKFKPPACIQSLVQEGSSVRLKRLSLPEELKYGLQDIKLFNGDLLIREIQMDQLEASETEILVDLSAHEGLDALEIRCSNLDGEFQKTHALREDPLREEL